MSNQRVKEWVKANPRKRHGHVLKHMYGITIDQWETVLVDQGETCAICDRPETWVDRRTGRVSRLSVDHNHETGDVRGLVCRRCNRVMGFVEDDPELVKKILEYLEVRNETPCIVV